MEPQVILVDDADNEIGVMDKLAAHREGRLHRAVSVFVFDTEGQLLLQKRAASKYHSGGLWSNTCCGHPLPGEGTTAAAHRRLKEEMGFDCELRPVYRFTYRVEFPDGMVEHEFDHVFVGRFSGVPRPDPSEAESWQWMDVSLVKGEMEMTPEKYTYWFRYCLAEVIKRTQS